MKNLGLIAGSGQFPLTIARSARRLGYRVLAAAHVGETDPALENEVDRILWIKIGQLTRLVAFFQADQVTEAVMAGAIIKKNMYGDFDLDEKALALVARLPDLSDDRFLRALADELQGDGITIQPAHNFAPDLVAREGLLTNRGLTPEEEADVTYGWLIAKTLGRLDLGQCVVVRHLTALALEAIDGTDETIRRGGRLARQDAVVVKVVKPNQDLRFDLPAVGLATIQVMKEVQARVLAVEAERTLIFDREEMIAAANQAGMTIVARMDKGHA